VVRRPSPPPGLIGKETSQEIGLGCDCV